MGCTAIGWLLIAALILAGRALGGMLPGGQAFAYTAWGESGTRDIYLQDVRGGLAINLTHHPADDQYPAWSPDGQRLVFVANREQLDRDALYLLHVYTGQVQRLATDDQGFGYSAWSPDGHMLAYWAGPGSAGTVYLRDMITGETRPAASDVTAFFPVVWSPDSRWLVYYTRRLLDGRHNVFALDVHSGERWLMAYGGARIENPAWSPDEASLVYQTDRLGSMDIFRLDLSTGHQDNLTADFDWHCLDPAWSPDGTWLAFTLSDPWSDTIILMDMEGGTWRSLISPSAIGLSEHNPTWSPDGQYLGFTSTWGMYTIYVLELATGERRRVTDHFEGNLAGPFWQPGGPPAPRRVVRSAHSEEGE